MPLFLNMDTADGPGTHWVLLYRFPRGIVMFGPLGENDLPTKSVMDFAKANRLPIYHNRIALMPYTSNMCGWVCLDIARRLRKNVPTTLEAIRACVADYLEGNAIVDTLKPLTFK